MYTRGEYKFKFNRQAAADLGFGGENNAINEPVFSPPIPCAAARRPDRCNLPAAHRAAARRKCSEKYLLRSSRQRAYASECASVCCYWPRDCFP